MSEECENYTTWDVWQVWMSASVGSVWRSAMPRARWRDPSACCRRPGSRATPSSAPWPSWRGSAAEEDGLASLVVGLPRRLDGSPNDMTPRVEAFAAALRARTALPVVLQDERLTSREAESRLALREKDWRVRKKQLDAAAAAIILQDYLDEQ